MQIPDEISLHYVVVKYLFVQPCDAYNKRRNERNTPVRAFHIVIIIFVIIETARPSRKIRESFSDSVRVAEKNKKRKTEIDFANPIKRLRRTVICSPCPARRPRSWRMTSVDRANVAASLSLHSPRISARMEEARITISALIRRAINAREITRSRLQGRRQEYAFRAKVARPSGESTRRIAITVVEL